MSGPRFVAVPAARLLGELREIGGLVTARGGRFVEAVHGKEVVVDVAPPSPALAIVRVYTSLERGASEVRDCGADAVRLIVGVPGEGAKLRPLEEATKILRTAPQGAEDRVATFLARLREAVRQAYGRAREVPACPQCGRAMGLRTTRDGSRRFYGCVGYPECRGTRSA